MAWRGGVHLAWCLHDDAPLCCQAGQEALLEELNLPWVQPKVAVPLKVIPAHVCARQQHGCKELPGGTLCVRATHHIAPRAPHATAAACWQLLQGTVELSQPGCGLWACMQPPTHHTQTCLTDVHANTQGGGDCPQLLTCPLHCWLDPECHQRLNTLTACPGA